MLMKNNFLDWSCSLRNKTLNKKESCTKYQQNAWIPLWKGMWPIVKIKTKRSAHVHVQISKNKKTYVVLNMSFLVFISSFYKHIHISNFHYQRITTFHIVKYEIFSWYCCSLSYQQSSFSTYQNILLFCS